MYRYNIEASKKTLEFTVLKDFEAEAWGVVEQFKLERPQVAVSTAIACAISCCRKPSFEAFQFDDILLYKLVGNQVQVIADAQRRAAYDERAVAAIEIVASLVGSLDPLSAFYVETWHILIDVANSLQKKALTWTRDGTHVTEGESRSAIVHAWVAVRAAHDQGKEKRGKTDVAELFSDRELETGECLNAAENEAHKNSPRHT